MAIGGEEQVRWGTKVLGMSSDTLVVTAHTEATSNCGVFPADHTIYNDNADNSGAAYPMRIAP